MSEGKEQPIIIIKKKGGHGGHHGGAWKVAYADFVTAMMALFIVLWLLSSDEKVKQAVGGYFQDPTGNGKLMGSTLAGAGEGVQLKEEDMHKLKEKLEAALKQSPNFQSLSKHVKITVTGEGLRIELLEDDEDEALFFQSGNARPTERGRELIGKLAEEVGRLPNSLYFEGHTDAKPFTSENTGYSNWELSTDRANAARRIMQENGVRPDQVGQVRGYAAQRPRNTAAPEHPSNRRITVMVQYLAAQAHGDTDEKEEDKGEESHGEKPQHGESGGHEKKEPPKEGSHGEKKAEHGEKDAAKDSQHEKGGAESKTKEHAPKEEAKAAAPHHPESKPQAAAPEPAKKSKKKKKRSASKAGTERTVASR